MEREQHYVCDCEPVPKIDIQVTKLACSGCEAGETTVFEVGIACATNEMILRCHGCGETIRTGYGIPTESDDD